MTTNVQQLRPIARRRLLLAALTLVTTISGAWAFGQILAFDGVGPLDVVLLGLQVVLFVWIALSFWTATIGLLRRWSRTGDPTGPTHAVPAIEIDVRTAILLPVYNEDPHRVFAGLRAIYESLQVTGHGEAFDFFVLSDTTDPDLWLAEELAWARLNQAVRGPSRIYYRHRPENIRRKAGNIADFCTRWGPAYRYMVVLDADSVMNGDTLVEMVRRMQQDSDIGILQVPPTPVNRVSVFARCQQFAARVYGPVFLEGFAWWSHMDGNYWGHNAIIRVDAFTQFCGMSNLPGAAPLGGEILSHDFVEAALMRRAGLKVCLAHDLEGSYEECPPTLVDYAQRDQRWCQGNMQHIRLVISRGMHAVSRLHFGLGAMSYLSSPLWLLFLVLSFVSVAFSDSLAGQLWRESSGERAWWAGGVFAATMALLLLPKLWGFLLLLRDPVQLAACGGAAKAGASILIETLVSILVAPIMMLFHSAFVVNTFLGRRVHWNAQPRGERGLSIAAAMAAHWKQTVAGVVVLALAWLLAPALLLWLSPVLAGLILSVPLSMLLSSVRMGQALARSRLMLTPDETSAPEVLRRHRQLLRQPPPKEQADPGGLFRRILADPAWIALHRSILLATDAARIADSRQVQRTKRQLQANGPRRISRDDRRTILADPEALSDLHVFAWTSSKQGKQHAPSTA